MQQFCGRIFLVARPFWPSLAFLAHNCELGFLHRGEWTEVAVYLCERWQMYFALASRAALMIVEVRGVKS
jgi:hypothetical protein